MRLTPLLFGAALLAAACDDDDPGDGQPTANVVQTARAAGLTQLVAALEATGLDATLAGQGPFTLFGPSDAAFGRLPDGLLAALDDEQLRAVLTYHVVPGELTAAAADGVFATAAGRDLAAARVNGTVVVGGLAAVVTADLRASNGVVHVIDGVLLPPGLAIPATATDLLASYAIFDTLVAALSRVGLDEALRGGNAGAGFTVFAPVNAAFAGVDLGALPDAALKDILLYHVAGNTLPATTVVGLDEVGTLQGGSIDVAVQAGRVVLDQEARILRTDLETTNGVVHVIDALLTPAP